MGDGNFIDNYRDYYFLMRCIGLFFGYLLLLAPSVSIATPQRIITLAPHLTEIAYAVGLGDKLVAVSDFSDYPAAALRLPRVSNVFQTQVNTILKLQPDLILAWQQGNSRRMLARLQANGFKVVALPASSYSAILHSIETVGELGGASSQAHQLTKLMQDSRIRLQQRYTLERKLRGVILLGRYKLFFLNTHGYIDELLKDCGAENLVSNQAPAQPVNLSWLIEQNPDFILAESETTRAYLLSQIAHDQGLSQRWRKLTLVFTPDWLERPGPRIQKAAVQICGRLSQARINFL